MRICLILGGVLLLAGCASPAMTQLQEACEAGDAQACSVIVQQRQAAVGALFNNRPQVYTPPPVQVAPPAQTTCNVIGNQVFCTSY